MRGLSAGPGTINHAGAVGDFPNVAVYRDDQSALIWSRSSRRISNRDRMDIV
jgi:hypothetical protein